MTSVAFDEDLLGRMSDLVVAVNRRRHAERSVAGADDAGKLRALAAEEERAEQAYVAALTMRGWRSPFALPRGA